MFITCKNRFCFSKKYTSLNLQEYDPLSTINQEQLGEKANESVLSAYVPSAVDANATRLTSIDDSVDEDEVFGEQEAEDEMGDEEDEEDIEEEEQKG